MQETGKFFYVKQIKTSDAMKKLLMIVVLAVLCQWGYSQYQPGDYYQEDGLDCMVLYVDKINREMYVMTLPGVVSLRVENMLETIDTASVGAMIKSASKLARLETDEMISIRNQRLSHLQVLKPLLGLLGENNTDVITDYCDRNGLALQVIFPEYNQIKELGEGWFMPGDRELGWLATLLGYKKVGSYIRRYSHKEMWAMFQAINLQVPNEKRRVLYFGLIRPDYTNQILRKFVGENQFGCKLSAQILKRIKRGNKKIASRWTGYACTTPFGFCTIVRGSSLGVGLNPRIGLCLPGYTWCIVDTYNYAYENAVTCAVKRIPWEK